MKIEDVRTAPERRIFATAVTVIVVLALVSLVLERRSGSDLSEIASSFASFAIILFVAVIRFFGRSSTPTFPEKLWITALWNAAMRLVARALPGADAASAEQSASASTTDDVRRRT